MDSVGPGRTGKFLNIKKETYAKNFVSYICFVCRFSRSEHFPHSYEKRRDASKYRVIYLKLNIALGTSNVVKGNKITMESGR